ncbi:GlsB/YeaQ/YmgE family stress response membrane protein [Chloroflexota bacterium]
MWLFNLIVTLIVGGLAGYIAGRVLRGTGYGIVGNVLLGLVGSFIGSIVFGLLGLRWIDGLCFIGGRLLVSAVGAVVFIVLIRIFVDSSFANK